MGGGSVHGTSSSALWTATTLGGGGCRLLGKHDGAWIFSGGGEVLVMEVPSAYPWTSRTRMGIEERGTTMPSWSLGTIPKSM